MDFAGGSWFNTPVSNTRTGNLRFDDISFGGMFEPLRLDHGVSFASKDHQSVAETPQKAAGEVRSRTQGPSGSRVGKRDGTGKDTGRRQHLMT